MTGSPTSANWTFDAHGEAQTDALGVLLGKRLDAGSVVGLIGDLGAGKTSFVQGIAAGLDVNRSEVASPTFSLVREYRGSLPIYHFDTYRLKDTDEFLELGADEMLAGDGVCLIEWADRMSDVLPKDVLWIEIRVTGETSRRFEFRAAGDRANRILSLLRESAKPQEG